jgi:hypothetical protein
MLLSSHRVSSACTGALTSDMALAVVEKTVNDSGFFRGSVRFRLTSCHATRL